MIKLIIFLFIFLFPISACENKKITSNPKTKENEYSWIEKSHQELFNRKDIGRYQLSRGEWETAIFSENLTPIEHKSKSIIKIDTATGKTWYLDDLITASGDRNLYWNFIEDEIAISKKMSAWISEQKNHSTIKK